MRVADDGMVVEELELLAFGLALREQLTQCLQSKLAMPTGEIAGALEELHECFRASESKPYSGRIPATPRSFNSSCA